MVTNHLRTRKVNEDPGHVAQPTTIVSTPEPVTPTKGAQILSRFVLLLSILDELQSRRRFHHQPKGVPSLLRLSEHRLFQVSVKRIIITS